MYFPLLNNRLSLASMTSSRFLSRKRLLNKIIRSQGLKHNLYLHILPADVSKGLSNNYQLWKVCHGEMSLNCFIKITQSSFSKYPTTLLQEGGKSDVVKKGKEIHIYLPLSCSVSKVTVSPDSSSTVLFSAFCPCAITNHSIPFHSQKCCNLDNKLYGYPVFSSEQYAHLGSTDWQKERFSPHPSFSIPQLLICISCTIVFLLSESGHSGTSRKWEGGNKRSSQDIYSLISLPAWLWSNWYGLSTEGHSSRALSTALFLASVNHSLQLLLQI